MATIEELEARIAALEARLQQHFAGGNYDHSELAEHTHYGLDRHTHRYADESRY